MNTTIAKHWKLYIDLNKVDSKDLPTIINMLTPNLAEKFFMGFRYLMARYWDRDTAYARALDIECTVYCGNIEVGEVNA